MPAQEVPPEVAEARRKLREKMGSQGAQVGGKGSMRRKSKPIPKSTHNDERKVAEIARKAGLQEIPGLDEANIIFNDGNVAQIVNPKVRGSLQANSFVVHGNVQQKTVSQLAPDMRGDNIQASNNSMANAFANNPLIASATGKLQAAFAAAGLSQADLANPEKQGDVAAAIEKAPMSKEEREIINLLMSVGSGAGGAEGGAEGDVPDLGAAQNFEEVAEAD